MTNKIEHTTLSFTKTDRYFKCQTTITINKEKKNLLLMQRHEKKLMRK